MKVIGIAGSLRARSNTLHYVKTGLTVLKEEGIRTELISLRGKEIKPCSKCLYMSAVQVATANLSGCVSAIDSTLSISCSAASNAPPA